MADPPPGCRSSLRRLRSTCWFRDDRDKACAVHREYGEDALPSACRQFPRVCVLEPRVVSVSLSHYCPTAAGLLFGPDPGFNVVTMPAAFPDTWPFEGLDARHAYPPFLRPGVSLGFDGLRAFEDQAVAALSAEPLEEALSVIETTVEDIRAWTPATGPLPVLILNSFARTKAPGNFETRAPDPRPTLESALAEGTTPAVDLPGVPPNRTALSSSADLVLRKYVASRLIGAWIVFQADDLRSVVRYLRLCLDTVLLFEAAIGDHLSGLPRWKEAIRNSDLWLLHYCDPGRLARNLR